MPKSTSLQQKLHLNFKKIIIIIYKPNNMAVDSFVKNRHVPLFFGGIYLSTRHTFDQSKILVGTVQYPEIKYGFMIYW